MKKNTIGVRLL